MNEYILSCFVWWILFFILQSSHLEDLHSGFILVTLDEQSDGVKHKLSIHTEIDLSSASSVVNIWLGFSLSHKFECSRMLCLTVTFS